jgi:hypothetical protein
VPSILKLGTLSHDEASWLKAVSVADPLVQHHAVSESLAGRSPFTIVTEVLETPEGYRIAAELLHPNHEGWQPAIPIAIE